MKRSRHVINREEREPWITSARTPSKSSWLEAGFNIKSRRWNRRESNGRKILKTWSTCSSGYSESKIILYGADAVPWWGSVWPCSRTSTLQKWKKPLISMHITQKYISQLTWLRNEGDEKSGRILPYGSDIGTMQPSSVTWPYGYLCLRSAADHQSINTPANYETLNSGKTGD